MVFVADGSEVLAAINDAANFVPMKDELKFAPSGTVGFALRYSQQPCTT